MIESVQRFADKYFETLNATQSAIYAGYSPATARQQGYEILQKDEVQDYLTKLRTELGEKTGITQQKILNELGRIAFSDIRKFYREDNQLIPICDLGDDEAAALASVKSLEETLPGTEIVIGTNKEIKLYDKLASIEKLMKHMGMFERDNEQNKVPVLTPTINVYNTAPPLATDEKQVNV